MPKSEYLIIGAGPAGLQLGYFLEKNNRDYLILEAAETVGTFFETFPRHGKLLSINKVHTGHEDPEVNLRWDWNSLLNSEGVLFKDYSQDYWPDRGDMVRYLSGFAEHFALKIRYGTRVLNVHKQKNGTFRVRDTQGSMYSSKYLIVASGVSEPYTPDIEGIELAENYTEVSIRPEDFAGQSVLIVGKGNSAFETAENLIGATTLMHLVSPTPLKLAWKSHYVGHVRSVNITLGDSYLLKSQNVFLDATVTKIEKRDDGALAAYLLYSHANSEEEELIYDRIISCTGFQFDASIFDESCMPELAINNRFPKQTSVWESVNVPGLYFAGTLMQQRDFKKDQSAFIHGFRYNIAFLARLFEHRYHGKEWDHRTIQPTAEDLTREVIERVNRSSSLWQQTDFICDLIAVQDGEIRYYQDMAVDYVADELSDHDHYYTVALEFGQAIFDKAPDVFAIERAHKDDVEKANKSVGIHPIIRRFRRGELIATHHVIEDVASEWKEPVHIEPLREFFANVQ